VYKHTVQCTYLVKINLILNSKIHHNIFKQSKVKLMTTLDGKQIRDELVLYSTVLCTPEKSQYCSGIIMMLTY